MNELREQFEKQIQGMQFEDMPNQDMQYVAHECGIETALTLLRKVAGSYLVVPRRNPFAKVIRRFVLDKFDGHNAKDLANACGCSRDFIYGIVQAEDLRRKEKVIERFPQLKLNLFDQPQGSVPERMAANG
jgi:Mor family transcriptional regulator